jgi:peptide/nickel transport system permease protein
MIKPNDNRDSTRPSGGELTATQGNQLGLPTMPPSRGWWRETWARLLRHRPSVVAMVILGLLIFGAIFAPFLSPYDRFEMDFAAQLQGPNLQHLLGTDETGRDLFSRLLWGGRISLLVALFAVLISMLIGIPWGMLAAFRGGVVDDVLMRIVDGMMAFPGLVFALLIIAALGPDIQNLVLTIGILGSPPFARIARSAVLSERERDYVLAARSTGVPDGRVAVRHIGPNTLPPMIVQISLATASAVLTEAALSFLGMGVQPPEASWATLLKQGYIFLSHNAWYVTFPGVAIFLTVWSLNALGDGLRDALDPRLRGTS